MKLKFLIGLLLANIALSGIAADNAALVQNRTDCFLTSSNVLKSNPGKGVTIVTYSMSNPKDLHTINVDQIIPVQSWGTAPLIQNSNNENTIVMSKSGAKEIFVVAYDNAFEYIVTDVRNNDCSHPNHCYTMWNKAC